MSFSLVNLWLARVDVQTRRATHLCRLKLIDDFAPRFQVAQHGAPAFNAGENTYPPPKQKNRNDPASTPTHSGLFETTP